MPLKSMQSRMQRGSKARQITETAEILASSDRIVEGCPDFVIYRHSARVCRYIFLLVTQISISADEAENECHEGRSASCSCAKSLIAQLSGDIVQLRSTQARPRLVFSMTDVQLQRSSHLRQRISTQVRRQSRKSLSAIVVQSKIVEFSFEGG